MTAVSRYIIDWDEKGFPCLADDCPNPKCGATALIVNEWNAVECLTCAWREFEPDDPRADFSEYPDESRATGQEEPGGSPRGRVIARAGAVLTVLAVFAAIIAWIAWLALNGWMVPG